VKQLNNKQMKDINQWIFEIPLEDIKTDNEDDGLNPCICCGKQIKNEKYYVHLLTNGNLVSTLEEFHPQEDQGLFPIGNVCRNKLPNNFYFKLK
jgi:hypothetical protein